MCVGQGDLDSEELDTVLSSAPDVVDHRLLGLLVQVLLVELETVVLDLLVVRPRVLDLLLDRVVLCRLNEPTAPLCQKASEWDIWHTTRLGKRPPLSHTPEWGVQRLLISMLPGSGNRRATSPR